jgi:hypothetical protein
VRARTGRRRVAVYHARGRQLVAVIEIVSPSNKADRRQFTDLVDKAVLLVEQGIHLLLIDPFPPTPRDPNGLHGVIWKALTRKAFALPADKRLTLVSYATGPDYLSFVEVVTVGDALPDMPLFLTPDHYVNVPLERTYLAAWEGFPEPLRPLLEDGT